MTLVDYQKNAELYAKLYADLNIDGTIYLAYRDLPSFLNKHVKGKRAVDYGCGAGKSTLFLKSLGFEVLGFDTNSSMIESTLKFYPDGLFEVIESGKIPLKEGTVDLVMASWVFMEISNKQAMLEVSEEINRILKPGGVFVTMVCSKNAYNNDWLSSNTEFPENKILVSGSRVKVHFKDINLTIEDYFWSEEDYEEIFKKSGLQIVERHQPLGSESDGYKWINEKKTSPYIVYILKKINHKKEL